MTFQWISFPRFFSNQLVDLDSKLIFCQLLCAKLGKIYHYNMSRPIVTKKRIKRIIIDGKDYTFQSSHLYKRSIDSKIKHYKTHEKMHAIAVEYVSSYESDYKFDFFVHRPKIDD